MEETCNLPSPTGASPRFEAVLFYAVSPAAEAVSDCRCFRALFPPEETLLVACKEEFTAAETADLLAAGADEVWRLPAGAEEADLRAAVLEHRAQQRPRSPDQKRHRPDDSIHWIPADDVPYGIIRSTAEGRLLEVNQSLVEMLGYSSREELIQVNTTRDLYYDPEDRKRLFVKYPLQIKGVEVLWKRRDGTPIPVQLSGRLIYDAKGNWIETEGIVLDWSPQREALNLLLLQRDLAVKLSNAQESSAIFQAILAAVIQIEDIDNAGIYLIDPATGSLQFRMTIGVSESFMRAVAAHPPNEHIDRLRQGKTFQGPPCVHPPPIAAACEEEGIKYIGLVPVLNDNRLIGVLGYASHSKDHFSLAAQHFVEAIAQWIGGTVARMQVEEALKSGQRNLQNLFDTLPDLVFIVTEDRKILDVNPAVEKRLGYRKEELLGKNVADVHPSEQRSGVIDLRDKIFRGELTFLTSPFVAKNGTLIPAETRIVRGDWGGKKVAFGIGRDLSEIHKTLHALAESEQRFRAIFENAATGLALSDLEGRILEVNAVFARMLGRPAEQIVGSSYLDFTHPDDAVIEKALIQPLLQGEVKSIQIEKRYQRAEGSYFWGRLTASLLQESQEKPQNVIGIVEDIDQRKHAEESLRLSEARYRGLIENLPDMVLLLDRDGKVFYVNRGTPEVQREELLGANVFPFVDESFQAAVREALRRAIDENDLQPIQVFDRFQRVWACRVVPPQDIGEPHWAMVIATDVTEQQKAQQALLNEQRLLRRLLELQERDRQMVAYELHDGFAQQLTAALLHLENFLGFRESDPALAQQQLHDGLEIIRRGLDEVRRLISGLRPLILDEAGVLQAIEYLVAEQRQRTGLEIVLKHDVRFQRLAPPLETAVFRIVQESLSNACRHSQSDFIRVELYQASEKLHIKVVDEGVGFDPAAIPADRFGLRGIRERTRLLGGHAKIRSQPGEGTEIHVTLPLVQPIPEVKDKGSEPAP